MCHGSMVDSRELAVLWGRTGQITAIGEVLRVSKLKTESVEVLTVNDRKEI